MSLSTASTETPTSLYRYYDKRDLLLYVGITSRGMTRNREHNDTKVWWQFVARQEVEHFPNRAAAMKKERELIVKLEPPFNKQHNAAHEALSSAYLLFAEGERIFPNSVAVMKKHKRRIPLRLETKFPALNQSVFVSAPEDFRLMRVLRRKNNPAAWSYRRAGALVDLSHEGFLARFTLEGKWIAEATSAYVGIRATNGGLIIDKFYLVTPLSSAESFGIQSEAA